MFSVPLVLYFELNDQFWHMQPNKADEKRKKPNTVMSFPNWNINVMIQSQACYIWYNTINDKRPSTSCLAVKHSKHNNLRVSRSQE